MIDHQHIRRHPGRHKPQAELFLYGLTYSRSPETDTMPVMTPRPIGRTLEELTQTSPMMPPVQEFDSDLLAMECTLGPNVPETIRQRVKVTRDLAVYGAFCYEFLAVAAAWAFSCVEMAIWTKYTESHPDNPTPPATLRPLADWATSQELLPAYLPPALVADIRNFMLHPKEFNEVLSPEMAGMTFQMLVDVVSRLWPNTTVL